MSCCAAPPASSTTSSCRACSRPRSCAARTPMPRSDGIDKGAALRTARRAGGADARRSARRFLTHDAARRRRCRARATGSELHRPVLAGERSRPCRRAGRPRHRRQPLCRRGCRRARRGRLRAAAGGGGLPRGARRRRAARASRTRRTISPPRSTMGYGDVERAFAAAAHRFRETLWQHRGGSHSIECRGTVAHVRCARGPADPVELDPDAACGASACWPTCSAATRTGCAS